MAGHIALLGDSVFDNRVYTRGDPDVAAHLRSTLGDSTKVTLLAVDGSTTTTIGPQLDRIPADATALVLSVGGNDALQHFDLLAQPVRSAAQGLEVIREAVEAFEERYHW